MKERSKKGELPLELQGVFDKEEVDVKVEDKKNEVCMSTKPVFQPFSGQGHRLGSATPKIVSKAKNIEVENKNNLSAVPLNNLEPISNIQIWLANGKRIVQKFNITHRISHIKPIIRIPLSSLNHLPKASLFNTITQGLGFNNKWTFNPQQA